MSLPAWAVLLLAYLVGSFPTAHLVGKANGVDLRTIGSGNLGATNVFRTLGWKWGLAVYVVDFLKGVIPVVWLAPLAGSDRLGPTGWAMASGVAAIAGHVRPVFLLGKGGGKGVATASGVFTALAPLPAACAIGAFVVTVALTRYVSLGSMIGAGALAVVLQVTAFNTPMAWVGTAVSLFVVFTHRDNIKRLRRGEERRIGSSSAKEASAS